MGNNPFLSDLYAFTHLKKYWGYLSVYGNGSLNFLDLVLFISRSRKNLNIFFNPALEDLAGLISLKKAVRGGISISSNSNLISLVGLDSIDMDKVQALEIFLNRNLSVCNLENICGYLATCKPAIIFKMTDNANFWKMYNRLATYKLPLPTFKQRLVTALFSMASPIWKVDTSSNPAISGYRSL